jgi:hypothetical protein
LWVPKLGGRCVTRSCHSGVSVPRIAPNLRARASIFTFTTRHHLPRPLRSFLRYFSRVPLPSTKVSRADNYIKSRFPRQLVFPVSSSLSLQQRVRDDRTPATDRDTTLTTFILAATTPLLLHHTARQLHRIAMSTPSSTTPEAGAMQHVSTPSATPEEGTMDDIPHRPMRGKHILTHHHVPI